MVEEIDRELLKNEKQLLDDLMPPPIKWMQDFNSQQEDDDCPMSVYNFSKIDPENIK